DVIVLDLGLPGLDGVEVCRRIRGFTDAWIIMLTSRDEEVDKVMGLSAGADDYVTKPFSSRELVARIRAVLRRTEASSARATTRHVGTMISCLLRGQPRSREAAALTPAKRSASDRSEVAAKERQRDEE